MKIKMGFGREGLNVTLPDRNVIKVLRQPSPVRPENPALSVREALTEPVGSRPLSVVADGHDNACIVINDVTRPYPNRIVLPEIIGTLERAGIAEDKITILIATGLHRPNEGKELEEMIGPYTADLFNVVNHRADVDEEQTYIGTTRAGTEVYIDKVYASADLKITCGLIEPHMMAGFSGGRKMIVPGIAAARTISQIHAPPYLEHANSFEGNIVGNILHNELVEIAEMAGIDFIVDAVTNEDHTLAGVFAGDFRQAHEAGCEMVRKHKTDTVPALCDIVVTSCAGYPLDATWYQGVKGMTAAMHICKPGGTIIMTCKCEEGVGREYFVELCRHVRSVRQFMDEFVHGDRQWLDQWQVNHTTRVLRRCHAWLVDGGLTDEQRSSLLVKSTNNFDEALNDAMNRHGPNAKIAVIPQGPYVLPKVKDR